MNRTAKNHFPDDVLEKYAMGRLAADAAAPIEEHLLVCSSCRSRLDALEEYIQVLRAALSALASDPTYTRPHLPREHLFHALSRSRLTGPRAI